MPSNTGLPPLECCRGTNPSQAANCRPFLKARASPMLATKAVAVIGPIPGIAARRRDDSFSRCHHSICSSNSLACRSSWRRWSASRYTNSRIIPGRPFSASSSTAGKRSNSLEIPCGIVMPNSASRPRSWLPWAVRALTKPWRARCSASRACCSDCLIGTKRMLGRRTASQIASASARSVLLPLT